MLDSKTNKKISKLLLSCARLNKSLPLTHKLSPLLIKPLGSPVAPGLWVGVVLHSCP